MSSTNNQSVDSTRRRQKSNNTRIETIHLHPLKEVPISLISGIPLQSCQITMMPVHNSNHIEASKWYEFNAVLNAPEPNHNPDTVLFSPCRTHNRSIIIYTHRTKAKPETISPTNMLINHSHPSHGRLNPCLAYATLVPLQRDQISQETHLHLFNSGLQLTRHLCRSPPAFDPVASCRLW